MAREKAISPWSRSCFNGHSKDRTQERHDRPGVPGRLRGAQPRTARSVLWGWRTLEREHLRDWPEGPWDLDGKVNGTALAEGRLADAPEMRALKMYVLLDEETEFQESIHKFIAFLSFSDLL